MNTDLLRTFLEVAKTRHFGHAAENLYLTQSAVSSRIKQLEDTVGVQVFTRQRNNILLTPAGERLLSHAENLLAAWQLAVQEVGAPRQQDMQLSIGGTSNLWDTFLQSVLPKLASHFPNLYMRTEINQSQHLIRSLLGGRLDIAVVLDAPTNIDLESRKIGNLELIMVCNLPDRSLADVPAIGHVFVDWGTAFNLQQARLFAEPVAPILNTGQSHIALEFVLSHKGAAYLPRALVEPYLKQQHLYQVKNAFEMRQDVHMVYARDADKSLPLGPAIRFIEELDIKPEDPLQEQ
ncbi:LysR family transcriptional regulator [Pseudoteredinibacter isoporae]|uniref:LysR family transcriptional regulator n=1 Tax=Pseudoteredinibacter isoporae TaxID=570281 RepID=UPI003108651C